MIHALFSTRGLLILFVVVLAAGLFHRSLRQVPTEAYVCLRDALQSAINWVDGARQRLITATRQATQAVGLGGDQWNTAFIVGAVVTTAFFVGFLVCEWQVVAESLEGLGIENAIPALPLGLGLLMGLSLVLPLVFAVWMLKELCGQAYLVPAHHFKNWERTAAAIAAGLVIVLSLSVITALGLFRAEALATPGTPASGSIGAALSLGDSGAGSALDLLDPGTVDVTAAGPWEQRATQVTMVALPISLALSAALAWETGVAMLLKLSPVALFGLLTIPVWIVGLTLSMLLTATNWVYAVVVVGLQWLQRVGIAVSRPMVEGFRWLSEWSDGRNTAGGVAARISSSWVWDIETPREGIGEQRSLDTTLEDGGAPEGATSDPDTAPGDGASPQPEKAESTGAAAGGIGAAEEIPINLDWSAETERPSHAWNPFPARDSRSTTVSEGLES